jgi:hypothetical protein
MLIAREVVMMMKIALVVGIVGAMFLTSIYAIAQTESANQKLGAPGAAAESDKNIGPKGKKQSSGSHESKGQSPAQSGGRTK